MLTVRRDVYFSCVSIASPSDVAQDRPLSAHEWVRNWPLPTCVEKKKKKGGKFSERRGGQNANMGDRVGSLLIWFSRDGPVRLPPARCFRHPARRLFRAAAAAALETRLTAFWCRRRRALFRRETYEKKVHNIGIL